MKKIVVSIIMIGFTLVSYGQSLNPNGLYVGKTLPVKAGSMIQRIDSATVDNMANPTTINFYHGTTNLSVSGTTKVNVADSTAGTGHYASNYDMTTGLALKLNTADTITMSDVTLLLTDTVPSFIFGAGGAAAGDSVLFAKNEHGFGMFNNYKDTLYIVNFDNIHFSSGDSLRFNVYWGNGMTLVATDSAFHAVTGCGTYQNLLTPDHRDIPPGNDVWIQLKADQITARRPKEWAIQLNKQTIRD
jgi:hypothetical protein